MQVIESTVKKLTITGVEGIDSIHVTLEDQIPGKGMLSISCCNDAFSYFWPAMGGRNISQFVLGASCDYITKCVCSHREYVDDIDELIVEIKKQILFSRRRDHIRPYEARSLFAVADSDFIKNDYRELNDLNHKVFGCSIYEFDIPVKINPEYAYVEKIVKAVQVALKQIG